MGSSRYVGRVGALAVVLGVGTVVAFPHTALADEADGSNGPVSASSQQAPSDATGVASADTNVEPPRVTATDSSTNAGANDEQGVGSGSPSKTVSAQTNTGSTTQSSTNATEPSSTPTTPLEATTEPAVWTRMFEYCPTSPYG